MDIIWLLYGLCIIPVAGMISAVTMLLKDFQEYRNTVLKRALITALLALLFPGSSTFLQFFRINRHQMTSFSFIHVSIQYFRCFLKTQYQDAA